MLKLLLERKGDVMLLTVPPMKGHLGLERALTAGALGPFEFWQLISDTESAVLELPILVWKRIPSHVLYDYHSYLAVREIEAKSIKLDERGGFREFYQSYVPPEDLKLVYVLEGFEYGEVADFPDENDIAVDLGVFELSQPLLRVSDPCYEKDTWCAATVEAVPGKWRAHVTLQDDEGFGFSVSRLTVVHESVKGIPDYSTFDAKPVCNAGVDSGQCGFFDDARYPNDKAQFEYEDDTFYGRVCETLSSPYEYGDGSKYQAAIIPDGFGVASRTFYGDGGYDCRVLRNAEGKVIAAYLWYAPKADPFFPSEDDESEE